MKQLSLADLLLPGAGLVLDGRPAAGLPLLVPAVLALAAALISIPLPGFAALVLPWAAAVYLLLAVSAAGIRVLLSRRERIDPAAVRTLARAASRAWLRGEGPGDAERLVRTAPELAQAWRLHALVTGNARSEARAAAIERR